VIQQWRRRWAIEWFVAGMPRLPHAARPEESVRFRVSNRCRDDQCRMFPLIEIHASKHIDGGEPLGIDTFQTRTRQGLWRSVGRAPKRWRSRSAGRIECAGSYGPLLVGSVLERSIGVVEAPRPYSRTREVPGSSAGCVRDHSCSPSARRGPDCLFKVYSLANTRTA
jgi:hypothetical protein